ncbi:hypothetical protein [Flagellimonas zhangzhouensis]|uniref:Uncharacterized protein n=1 Tax=Flagellimonas zhangzhouensis TaxID=1073328 RepID=A0A1H2Z8K1_9FLAO|nr:hypothetical protein [Allomuricauda zhangzhouensis]SDR07874.1 hypothetical protein SAMN05216294_3358 [Allomuricauda zhangzhouensis]SDX13655.1 hypothetical protein SAMN04487892_3353 [Allomuricauda zhangzhouensis]
MEKVLDRKIKIIWDFRGPGAAKTAEHYKIHLEEFVVIEELKFDLSGVEHFGPTHSIAYLVVAEFELKEIREILKPHRGQVYTGNI